MDASRDYKQPIMHTTTPHTTHVRKSTKVVTNHNAKCFSLLSSSLATTSHVSATSQLLGFKSAIVRSMFHTWKCFSARRHPQTYAPQAKKLVRRTREVFWCLSATFQESNGFHLLYSGRERWERFAGRPLRCAQRLQVSVLGKRIIYPVMVIFHL